MTEHKRYFAENMWYAAAWEYQVAEADNRLARTICETPLVFYKGEKDNYIALDDRCCHRAAPLSIGRVEGNCIRCMYHGLLYDETGQVIEIPGQDHVAKSLRVRSYPVVSKGGMLWIWMGDPALADSDDIYDFPALSDKENWRGFDKAAYLHYNANWLLIIDNLADFSHVAFVHTNTLGGSESYAYNTVAEKIQKDANGFSNERWDRNSRKPPFHAKVVPAAEVDKRVDRLNIIEMRLPGIFLMETIFAPLGWNPEIDTRDNVREYRNCQFMTPETRDTSHFFWNYFHNWEMDDPSISASLKESMLEGFLEDKAFIEAQQQLLNNSPDFAPRAIAADEAFVHFRNRWTQCLKQEDEANPISYKENKRSIL